MAFPNFLVIGAARSGTTSLYRYLDRHPEVFLGPVREPHFFAFAGERVAFRGPGDHARTSARTITDPRRYEELFEGVTTQKAVGAFPVWCLYAPRAAANVHRYAPRAKLIALLRHPVERAYSSWLFLRREGYEPLADFREALAAEDGRVRDRWGFMWHYKQAGFYHAQLERYAALFPRGQIRVHLFDDFAKDPAGVVRDLCAFIGVDPELLAQAVEPRGPEAAGAEEPRRGPLQAVLASALPGGMRRFFGRPREEGAVAPMPEEARAELLGAYREDLRKLGDFIGRDLGPWIAGREEADIGRGQRFQI